MTKVSIPFDIPNRDFDKLSHRLKVDKDFFYDELSSCSPSCTKLVFFCMKGISATHNLLLLDRMIVDLSLFRSDNEPRFHRRAVSEAIDLGYIIKVNNKRFCYKYYFNPRIANYFTNTMADHYRTYCGEFSNLPEYIDKFHRDLLIPMPTDKTRFT